MVDIADIQKFVDAPGTIPFPHGAETLRVFRRGDWVYKIRHQNLERENIEWHNEFFGDTTPYEIIGDAVFEGWYALVLRQPYVDLVPRSDKMARAQLIARLCQNHTVVLSAKTEVWADGWHFDNLDEPNVGIDIRSGKFAVVDCLIRKRSENFVRDLWRGCNFEIIEHKYNGILRASSTPSTYT